MNVVAAPRPLEVLPAEVAGNHGYVNACLWLAPGPAGAIPAETLVSGPTLTEVIAAYAARYPSCDRRAVVSMWLQIYLASLLPPLFAASLVQGRALPAALADVSVLLAEDGTSSGFVVQPGSPAIGDAFGRFEVVLFEHVGPLIEALAGLGRISRRLLWSNVAEAFQSIAEAAEHMPGVEPHVAYAADTLLESVRFPDGRRNPLYGLTRYRPTDHEHRHRSRRICCLRYMLPDFGRCAACPLDPDAAP